MTHDRMKYDSKRHLYLDFGRQSHNFILIDLKFGMSDYVREVTSPAKFGSDPMSGRDATWAQHIRVLGLSF